MTNQEYLEAYRQARKIYPDLTKEAMTRLRQIYINASESVANQIRVAELAGRSQLTIDSLKKIEQELRIAAEKIRQAVQSSVINLSSEGIQLQSNINYSYITDLFQDVDKITKLGISNMLVGVDVSVISSIVNRLYTDGYSFSDRVWAIGEAYQSTIKDIISAGLAQGRDVVKIARDLEVYLRGGKISLVQRYGELLRDTKEFMSRIGNTIDSRALRLLMSELYASLQQAALWHGKINPACTGMYDWIMELGRQDWNCVCPKYAEKQYKYEDVPAYPHPHCRCEIRPVLMDHNIFMNDLQNWVNGGSVGYIDNWYNEFYLPYQMSY